MAFEQVWGNRCHDETHRLASTPVPVQKRKQKGKKEKFTLLYMLPLFPANCLLQQGDSVQSLAQILIKLNFLGEATKSNTVFFLFIYLYIYSYLYAVMYISYNDGVYVTRDMLITVQFSWFYFESNHLGSYPSPYH